MQSTIPDVDFSNPHLIEALKLESAELNGRIQEVYKAVYTLFGTVLPAVLTVFALLAKDTSEVDKVYLAFIFIVVVSFASLWASSLWMEALAFLRYRYVQFQPRLYRATGQQGQPDVATFSEKGQPLRWFPSTILNAMLFLIIFSVWWKFIPAEECVLRWTAFLFLLAAIACFVSIHVARRQYVQEMLSANQAGK